MTSYLLAGPESEPLSLDDAKAFLRIGDSTEDGLIATLITAARIHLEGITGRAMLAQSWRLVLDAWPTGGVIELPVGPFISLTAITAYDVDGIATDITLAGIEPDAGRARARLFLPANLDRGPLLRDRQGVEIDYVAGFGTAAGDVPADLIQALKILVAHWFENRDAVIIAGSGTVVPVGFDGLVANYRQVRL